MRSYRIDVCIVGAGPAGIAMAEVLAEAGRFVWLVESGEREPDQQGAALNIVHTDRRSVKEGSRARAFGGSTKLWSGRWKMLDEIDFKNREWVPESGWPISASELAPLYEEAAKRFGGPALADLQGISITKATRQLCGDALEPTVLWTLPHAAFDIGALHWRRVCGSPQITCMLGATAHSIEYANNSITRIKVADRGGQEVAIEANRYVLATGGIENARLLLSAGLGGPAAGRYFMEHPKGVLATIRPRKGYRVPKEWLKQQTHGGVYRIGLRLPNSAQRALRILNSYLQLEPIYPRDFASRALRMLGYPIYPTEINVVSYLEQAPDADNHVVLISNCDPLGMPRALVSYDLSEQDKRTVIDLHTVLKKQVEQAGLGSLEWIGGKEGPDWSRLRDASHHMGTTRMGTDLKNSVVDPHCKVHGVDNLFVAGSSVFPTSGHANPTATLIALALRLAHHLADE